MNRMGNSIGAQWCITGVVILSALGCVACSDGIPVVVEAERIGSPDSKHEATIELVDNGLGFGQGALYDEVHVWVPGAAFVHGDPDGTVVFYAESTYREGVKPTVHWIDAERLLIRYPNKNAPGRMKSQILNVAIVYEPIPLRSDTSAQSWSQP